MRRIGRVAGRVAAGVCAVLVLGGCTTTIDGSAEPAPAPPTTEAPQTADPTPAPEPSIQGEQEARRIAGATVLSELIYPEFTDTCTPNFPFVFPDRLDGAIFAPGTASATYATYGFVAGWSSCRTTDDGERAALIFNAEMSDRDSAQVAAEELVATFQDMLGAEPVELPGFESLPAVTSELVDGGTERTVYEVFLPEGRMLAYFYLVDPDQDRLEETIGELIEEQRELLQDFEPTPQDEIADIELDAYDLERRTADVPGSLSVLTGSYDLPAYLHVAIDPALERDILSDNGFDGSYVEVGENSLGYYYQLQTYQMGSLEEADAAFADFNQIEAEEFEDRVPFLVPEDATIPCFYVPADTPGGPIFQRCYSREGRYLGATDVSGAVDPADIEQIRFLVQEQITGMRAP